MLKRKLPFFLAYMKNGAAKPTFLEYVENTNDAYINTGILPTYDMTVKVKYKYTKLNSTFNPIFGMRTAAVGTGDGLFWAGMHYADKQAYLRFGGNSINYAMGDSALDVIELTASPDGIFINGVDTGARYYDGVMTSQAKPMFLFTMSSAGAPDWAVGHTNARVYSFEVYDGNGVLIQNLRPALDPNGKACMYDTVTKKYFYNAGTGELKAGGRFVESIYFDGDSWVDIGYIPSSNTRVVGSFLVTRFKNSAACYVFGVFGDSANFGLNIGSDRSKLNVPWAASSAVTMENPNNLDQRYLFDISKNGAYIDGVLKLSASQLSNTFTATKPFFVGWSNGTSTEKIIGKIYPIKIYENDILMQDLRPYVDGNGVACFKDVLTDTLFYNQGTGALGHTEHEELEFIYLDGNQYIDTGITYQTCTINTAIKYNAGLSARMLSGWSDIQATYWGMNANERLELGGGIVATGTNLTKYSFLNIYVDATNETITASVGGASISRVGDKPNGVQTYKIGCCTTASSNKVIGNVYYHKIYDVDGKLIQDLIPVKRSDGIVCMYDRVESKYYELINA